jgi:hypothetical protein
MDYFKLKIDPSGLLFMSLKNLKSFFNPKPTQKPNQGQESYSECNICMNNNSPLIDKSCKCSFKICKDCINKYTETGCPQCGQNLMGEPVVTVTYADKIRQQTLNAQKASYLANYNRITPKILEHINQYSLQKYNYIEKRYEVIDIYQLGPFKEKLQIDLISFIKNKGFNDIAIKYDCDHINVNICW